MVPTLELYSQIFAGHPCILYWQHNTSLVITYKKSHIKIQTDTFLDLPDSLPKHISASRNNFGLFVLKSL